ncbi:hypothetical protein MKW92_045556 [Papaver armeniacum]|nr:hypothetical protein MKW92_045556 [Papaver armeniacum]
MERAVNEPKLPLFNNLAGSHVSMFVRELQFYYQRTSIQEISHVLWAALGCWSFFVFIAFTMFLPVMVLMPQKFAICFTLGCIFIIESFFALKGPKNQLAHMSSKERLPFTLGFIATMVGTIYVSKVLRSYLFSLFFFVFFFPSLVYSV